MKEIDKQDTPDVAGGYRDSCIPMPQPMPILPSPEEMYGGLGGDYPKSPSSTWDRDIYVTDPPQV